MNTVQQRQGNWCHRDDTGNFTGRCNRLSATDYECKCNEKYPHDPDKKNISDYMGKDCDQINYCYKNIKFDGWEEQGLLMEQM